MNKLKSLYITIKKDALEYYALTLLVVGLPVIAWIYFDWRAALAVTLIVQAVICVLALKKRNV